jgi:hypothetical protein
MFGEDRASLRRVYHNAWTKHQQGRPLEPLEPQIVAVLQEHPEFHAALGPALDSDYPVQSGAANPFLHLGLHLAIRDQIDLDRPPGIRGLFGRLAATTATAHAAEHLAMEQLSETLREAQRSGVAPDDHRYLKRLQQLALRQAQRL